MDNVTMLYLRPYVLPSKSVFFYYIFPCLMGLPTMLDYFFWGTFSGVFSFWFLFIPPQASRRERTEMMVVCNLVPQQSHTLVSSLDTIIWM